MATGALDANGIWQYGEDDSEPTFSGLLNKLASSTSTTVTRLEELSGLTAAQLTTHRNNLGVGLVKVVPTSVTYVGGTGTTIDGVANASACTSVTLNGVFTSEFTHYVIRYVVSIPTTTDIYFRLSSGGTASTDNWTWGAAQIANTGVPSGLGGSTANYGWLTSNNGSVSEGDLTISSPAIASQKTYRTDAVYSGKRILSHGYQFTSYVADGIQIYPAANLIYGTITVFGINK